MLRSLLLFSSKRIVFARNYTTALPVLQDSVSGLKKEIKQTREYLSWYSCGPTVYDSSHVGHARTYVQIDIMQRILEKRFGYNVYNALGITNIDDKIINKSKETQIPWKEIADKYENEYFSDMAKLNVQVPKSVIRVSDTIQDIIEYIRILIDKQVAYVTSKGVYFDTQSPVYHYSKLVPSIEDAESQSRISSDAEKKHPRDFALWKFTNEENYNWNSPWGKGRPGWHIECSTNCHLLFGDHLDIHAGGIDLKFPHHCNEIAQSEAYLGQSNWCDTMVHIGHIFIQGRKMSKSLKNFITITDMLKDYSSDDFRMFCLLNHYSARVQLDDNGLIEAKQTWKSLHDSLTLVSTELQKRKNSQSDRSREFFWINQFGTLRRNVDSFLLNNMNTRGVITSLQSTLNALSKDILSTSATVPYAICESIVEYTNELLEDMGFLNCSQVPVSNAQQGILDTMCLFRKNVRNTCVVCMDNEVDGEDVCIRVLQECDRIRQEISDQYHISLVDGKEGLLWVTGELPKKGGAKKEPRLVPSMPPEDLFYDLDKYSCFDEQGIPTCDQEGKPLSASKRKKLVKQFNTHKAIHEKWLARQKRWYCLF